MPNSELSSAARVLKNGGVVAYPTEYCFGLGCDPRNAQAVRRILKIKQRQESQGLILVAANPQQVEQYAVLQGLPRREQILASWPGANTWLLPKTAATPEWVSGQHETVAMRISKHPLVRKLCEKFGGAIVSTSANRHGQQAHTSAAALQLELGAEIDFLLDGELSEACGDQLASAIFDAASGEQLR